VQNGRHHNLLFAPVETDVFRQRGDPLPALSGIHLPELLPPETEKSGLPSLLQTAEKELECMIKTERPPPLSPAVTFIPSRIILPDLRPGFHLIETAR